VNLNIGHLETGGGELIAILQVLAHRTCSLHTSELVQAGLVGSFVGKLWIDQLEPFFLAARIASLLSA
jgi:hypothetical protein